MLFADKIRRLKDEIQMLQWKLAATMDIDAPPFSKIERGKRHAKHEQVIAIAKILQIYEIEFIILWFSDKYIASVGAETKLAHKAIKIALHKANQIKIIHLNCLKEYDT
ncbi:MAG: XRE family transcriptional regulator [Prevotellaceae bacterium]|nr:XRE family transcriptional regulator [Prevotellaceae bacterium]